MPGNLIPAQPSEVMPMIPFANAFEEIHYFDALLDEYADGRSTRARFADLIEARRSFRLSRALRDYELEDLRGFYFAYARYGEAFWFYNLAETVPRGSFDPDGADPIGRYTVVWEGGWRETVPLGLDQTAFVLREVV